MLPRIAGLAPALEQERAGSPRYKYADPRSLGLFTVELARHIKAVFDEAELNTASVVARYATTAADGKTYQVDYYALEMILAVGYRVRSQRGTQFRQWATARLKAYLVKGFVLDEKRLRDPGPFDYFDELLAKIRDIRASEKRFYQKVRGLYTTVSTGPSRLAQGREHLRMRVKELHQLLLDAS